MTCFSASATSSSSLAAAATHLDASEKTHDCKPSGNSRREGDFARTRADLLQFMSVWQLSRVVLGTARGAQTQNEWHGARTHTQTNTSLNTDARYTAIYDCVLVSPDDCFALSLTCPSLITAKVTRGRGSSARCARSTCTSAIVRIALHDARSVLVRTAPPSDSSFVVSYFASTTPLIKFYFASSAPASSAVTAATDTATATNYRGLLRRESFACMAGKAAAAAPAKIGVGTGVAASPTGDR